MKLLAIDTASRFCSACIFDAARDNELARKVLDLGKGHAEHLMATIDDVLGEAQTEFAALGAIAVNIGPGSFTGVRVGVSVARGLALALGLPAVGVTALEAIAEQAFAGGEKGPLLVAIDAHRGEAYTQLFEASTGIASKPLVLSLQDAVVAAQSVSAVVGSAAAAMRGHPAATGSWRMAYDQAAPDIAVIARLAARKGTSGDKPKPLYLRAPDAKPQSGAALPRKVG